MFISSMKAESDHVVHTLTLTPSSSLLFFLIYSKNKSTWTRFKQPIRISHDPLEMGTSPNEQHYNCHLGYLITLLFLSVLPKCFL